MRDVRQRTQVILQKVLAGDKPAVNPASPSEKWLYDFADNMNKRLFLCEEPFCHFTLPDDVESDMEWKGDTRDHPVSSRMLQQFNEYRSMIGDNGYFHFLGVAADARKPSFDPNALPAEQPVIIPAEGDFVTLSYLHKLLVKRLQVNETGEDASLSNLYVDNSKGTWTDYLNEHFSEDELTALSEQGVTFIDKEKDLKPVLKSAIRQKAGYEQDMILDPGSLIIFNTSNFKKIFELQDVFERLGAKVTVVPYCLVASKPEEAEEMSRTYAGNNSEKLDLAAKAIEKEDPQILAGNLRRFGAKPENTWILSEDRGLEILEDLTSGPEFSGFSKWLNPKRGGPGVELAHILKGMPIPEFYSLVAQAAERKGIDLPEALDFTCYQMRPLTNPTRENAINVFAASRDRVHADPIEIPGESLYSENFLSDTADPKGRRKCEVEDYIERYSSTAAAAETLATMTGADRHIELEYNPFTPFNRNAANENPSVATCVTAFPTVRGHGTPKFSKRLKPVYEAASTSMRYDFTGKPAEFSVPTEDGGFIKIESSLNKFYTMVKDNDAFYFSKRPPMMDKSPDRTKLFDMFQFSSLVVGHQVFDPNICNKPLLVNRREWADNLEIYDDLHAQSFAGDKPQHMFTVFDTDKEGLASLKAKQEGYTKIKPFEDVMSVKGFDNPDLFHVAIYCSATTTCPNKLDEAYRLTYELCRRGIGVINGGGAKGMMERVSQAVLDFRQAQKDGLEDSSIVTHLTCIQCQETCRAEGMFENADKTIITDNIYNRMDILQQYADAEIVDAGGVGTLQEWCGSNINRLNGNRDVANRPLIVINREASNTHKNERVYDGVLKHMPDSIMEACNNYVVDESLEAIELVTKARDKSLDIANDNSGQSFDKRNLG